MRAWLALRLYRSAGRLWDLGRAVEGAQGHNCPDCGLELQVPDEGCAACERALELQRIAADAYDAGARDGFEERSWS